VNSQEKERFLKKVKQLLNSQRVGVLATLYRQIPHQSLIAYISSEDLRNIFFVTPLYTRKVAAMAENPLVALLVDNRQNAESDFDKAAAVTIKGRVEKLDDDGQHSYIDRYLERHPYLAEFAASPSCGFYLIKVISYSLVSRFQKVEELLL
jgi:nitroimidazol reductase NimA-like FMN-containing flavoprotein (pyridoxamine 5'-phosphate oxidase superfamily)